MRKKKTVRPIRNLKPAGFDEIAGLNLRAIRKQHGLTQAEMAKVLDIHQTAECRVEAGKQSLTLEQHAKLIDWFDLSDRWYRE